MFGIQRELPGQIVVEANYIRAHGYDLAVSRNLNFVPRQFLGTTRQVIRRRTLSSRPRFRIRSATSFRAAVRLIPLRTITRAQSLLAFPQFTNLWVQEYNGTNRYNSLQVQVNKRFATDMTLTATYTYSNLREKVNI